MFFKKEQQQEVVDADLLKFEPLRPEAKFGEGARWIHIKGLVRYQNHVADQMKGLGILTEKFFARDYSSLVLINHVGFPISQIVIRDGRARLEAINDAISQRELSAAYKAAVHGIKQEVLTTMQATDGHYDMPPKEHTDMFERQILPYVTKFEHKDGRLHSEDGPAFETAYGTRKWFRNGLLDNPDGPAIVYPNGEQRYFSEGFLHRDDGPSIIKADGTELFAHMGTVVDRAEFEQVAGTATPRR